MNKKEKNNLKNKMLRFSPNKWWGDDYDVRFYLVSKLKELKNKKILDIGGGVGIISSEMNSSNEKFNLDFSFEELKICSNIHGDEIKNISGDMTNLPFLKNTFDIVISSSVLQYAKDLDIKKKGVIKKNAINEYIHVEKSLSEIKRVLKDGGILFLVTPNNMYYKSYMLNYDELNAAIKNHFTNYKISLYNTFPKLSEKYRKLNLANIIPKILSKIINEERMINQLLIKNKIGKNKYSVSFFVKIKN